MNLAQRKARRQISAILLTGAVLIISFQNFSDLPLEKLKPQFARARAIANRAPDGTQDIRDLAPARPNDFGQFGSGRSSGSLIAPLDRGSDLGSIQQNWLRKESDLITGGADQRILKDLNHRLQKLVKSEEPQDEPRSGDRARDPAQEQSSDPSNSRDLFSLAPTSLRLSRLNKFQMGFANRTQVSCLLGGDGLEVDLSRPLNDKWDVGLKHQSSKDSNSVRFQYNW